MIKNYKGYHFVDDWPHGAKFYKYDYLSDFESDKLRIEKPHYLPEEAPSSVINKVDDPFLFRCFLDKCCHE